MSDAVTALMVSRVLAASTPVEARKAPLLVGNDQAAIVERRANHRRLVAQYRSLLAGDAGEAGVRHAERWLAVAGEGRDLARCPGSVRVHDVTGGGCGVAQWVAYSCRNALCPFCAGREAQKVAVRLHGVLVVREPLMRAHDGLFLRTFTAPNIKRLTRDALNRFQAAVRAMRRSSEYKSVTEGGYSALEVTFSHRRESWHPHTHELVESSSWPLGQACEIAWSEDDQRWLVIADWSGAMLTWSRCLAKQGLLAGFDPKNPATWAFADIQDADVDDAVRIARYISKATPSDLPLPKLLDLALALSGEGEDAGDGKPKRFRRRDLFGVWRGVKAPKPEASAVGLDDAPAVEIHECKNPLCEQRDGGTWTFQGNGIPDGAELWWVVEGGGYFVVPQEVALGWRIDPRSYPYGRLRRSEDSGRR